MKNNYIKLGLIINYTALSGCSFNCPNIGGRNSTPREKPIGDIRNKKKKKKLGQKPTNNALEAPLS